MGISLINSKDILLRRTLRLRKVHWTIIELCEPLGVYPYRLIFFVFCDDSTVVNLSLVRGEIWVEWNFINKESTVGRECITSLQDSIKFPIKIVTGFEFLHNIKFC